MFKLKLPGNLTSYTYRSLHRHIPRSPKPLLSTLSNSIQVCAACDRGQVPKSLLSFLPSDAIPSNAELLVQKAENALVAHRHCADLCLKAALTRRLSHPQLLFLAFLQPG